MPSLVTANGSGRAQRIRQRLGGNGDDQLRRDGVHAIAAQRVASERDQGIGAIESSLSLTLRNSAHRWSIERHRDGGAIACCCGLRAAGCLGPRMLARASASDGLERCPDHRRFFKIKDAIDLHHSVAEIETTKIATIAVVALVGFLRGANDGRVLATDALELRAGRVLRVGQEQCLVRRGRDTRDRADLHVRDGAKSERVIDQRQLGEPASDAKVLARGADVPADSPREPIGARASALLVPTVRGVELAQVGEQRVGGGVEVGGVRCDALAQIIEIDGHDH